MAQTMSMGQAVGLAAALSIERACGAREVPINVLQHELRTIGAVIETPSHIADTSPGGWRANR
jgi:hypothetical protein